MNKLEPRPIYRHHEIVYLYDLYVESLGDNSSPPTFNGFIEYLRENPKVSVNHV